MRENKTKNILGKSIDILSWIILAVAAIMAVITIFVSSGDENGKGIFGARLLVVTSGSMSKSELSIDEQIFFDAGDIIIIKRIENPATLKEGDVITFISHSPESLGKTVTHKIREIRYSRDGSIEGFVTYGINTGKNDTALAKPESVIGKYSFKIERLGELFAFLKTPKGYYISVLFPILLLIIFFWIKISKILEKPQFFKYYEEELELLKARASALEEKRNLPLSASLPEPTQASTPPESEAVTASDYIKEIEENEAEAETAPGFSIPKGKRVPFSEKLLKLPENTRGFFESIHNELLSFKRVKARISFRCISYRLGRRLLAKMTVSGKTLRLHLALDVDSFNRSVFFQRDMSDHSAYRDVPFTVKVKSPRAEGNAKKLLSALAEKEELIKNNKQV